MDDVNVTQRRLPTIYLCNILIGATGNTSERERERVERRNAFARYVQVSSTFFY